LSSKSDANSRCAAANVLGESGGGVLGGSGGFSRSVILVVGSAGFSVEAGCGGGLLLVVVVVGTAGGGLEWWEVRYRIEA
jgi:hypothetical protein